MNYYNEFEAAVFTRLGGLDMAREFFERHPEVNLKEAAKVHEAAERPVKMAAAAFYSRTVKPRLDADYKFALQFPWHLDEIEKMDGRN
jgi:hypothetical protein